MKVEINMADRYTGEILVDGVKVDKVVAIRFEVDVRPESICPASVEVVQLLHPTDLRLNGQEVDVTTLANFGSRQYAKADDQA